MRYFILYFFWNSVSTRPLTVPDVKVLLGLSWVWSASILTLIIAGWHRVKGLSGLKVSVPFLARLGRSETILVSSRSTETVPVFITTLLIMAFVKLALIPLEDGGLISLDRRQESGTLLNSEEGSSSNQQ